jgi:hypothetical protein
VVRVTAGSAAYERPRPVTVRISISGTHTLFLIDEMHNLDTSALAAICIAFQAISRRGLPVALVGAGLPDLQVRLIAAKPYADRLFQYRELGRLPDAAARAALVGPAATLGVEYEEKAARQVVRESAGYPYFIQEYGLELWNHAEQSPGRDATGYVAGELGLLVDGGRGPRERALGVKLAYERTEISRPVTERPQARHASIGSSSRPQSWMKVSSV